MLAFDGVYAAEGEEAPRFYPLRPPSALWWKVAYAICDDGPVLQLGRYMFQQHLTGTLSYSHTEFSPSLDKEGERRQLSSRQIHAPFTTPNPSPKNRGG
jgi:hypothetical protein